jgi:hypothetical protein
MILSRGGNEERLRFETLLSDISVRFITLPSSQVDA